MDCMQVFDTIKRDAEAIISEEAFLKKLKSGKKLRIKLGADPSRPDLHLGHSVVLRKLRLLQNLGHEIIFVIGDFTGMIGDPSGRNKTRQPLTFEQTRENAKSYFEQVVKILDASKTRITYNSEWLSKLNFADVLTLAGKYTVARVLERDDFAKRIAENAPVGMHELFYPLMQGYDSVALEADIEVGGKDQTFNLLVGRELQRDYGQPPQDVITFPLLPGLDGVEKMSKSLDNYIGIDEPPEVMYEKCMRVPDNLLDDYFRLTTDLPQPEVAAILAQGMREAHFSYADEIVALYWDEAAARRAKARYLDVASGAVPDEIPEVRMQGPANLVELVRAAGFAPSNSEARRLIQGRGIKIDGEAVTAPEQEFSAGTLVLSRGKNRFARMYIEG